MRMHWAGAISAVFQPAVIGGLPAGERTADSNPWHAFSAAWNAGDRMSTVSGPTGFRDAVGSESPENLDHTLNSYAAEGWRVISSFTASSLWKSGSAQIMVLLERETPAS